ncbi:MAG TPA: hypothetical protein PLD84_01005 [Chitinophagales bacterium]|nr:hypothetical protein [Chitinophagales bacterium]
MFKIILSIFVVIFFSNCVASAQKHSNLINLNFRINHFPDWERGTFSLEGQFSRSISPKIDLTGSISYVNADILSYPDINIDSYVGKITERNLAYFDLSIQTTLLELNEIPVCSHIFFGPSYMMGGEFLFYGIIDVGFPEVNGGSLHRNSLGFNAGLDVSVNTLKRMEISAGVKLRAFIEGKPMYSYGVGIGYCFNAPFDKKKNKT